MDNESFHKEQAEKVPQDCDLGEGVKGSLQSVTIEDVDSLETVAAALAKEVQTRNQEIAYLNFELGTALKRASLTNEIGQAVFASRRSLTRFFKLPFDLMKIRKKYRKRSAKRFVPTIRDYTPADADSMKKTVLFMCTNGGGLGHLTRSLAIAKRMKRLVPDWEFIFLSTSPALSTIRREGFKAYYLPPHAQLEPAVTSHRWNILLRNTLNDLFALYNFSVVIFDGAYPYAALVNEISGQERLYKIWVKRGSAREKARLLRDKQDKFFDRIIAPEEAGRSEEGTTDREVKVSPIILLDESDLWTREEVRTMLKIPQDKKVCYIQLGAGNINDIDSDIHQIVKSLRKRRDVMMIVGESIIGSELKLIEDDIIVLKDYPNSKYVRGFDLCVSACGYNSFHELMYFGVPTLFIPNMNTVTDDQYARAVAAEESGCGIVMTELSEESLDQAFNLLCDSDENRKMSENRIKFENGAMQAAELLVLSHPRMRKSYEIS